MSEPSSPGGSRQVRVEVSLKVHPTEAVLAAANILWAHCPVTLEKERPGRMTAILEVPSGQDPEALRERFLQELLWETLRLKIAKRTETVRQLLLGRALLAAEPLDLDAGDLAWIEEGAGDADYLDDPLGIAVPWEERFGSKAEQDEEIQPGRSPEDLGTESRRVDGEQHES